MARKNQFATPPPQPTLEQRHAQLTRRADLALDTFTRAATELEVAADELDVIAAEAQAIAEAHEAQYVAADNDAAAARAKAAKIRSLFA